jgi:AcrR family transcriptional regulator
MSATEDAPPLPRRVGRPKAADSAATRRRILAVAQRELATQGYGNATIKDIAAAAGLTTGAIFYYFPTKRALFEAVTEDAWVTIETRFRERAASATDFVGRFAAMLEGAADLNVEHAHIAGFAVLVGREASQHPELADVARQWAANVRRLYRDLVDAAVTAGEIDPAIDPRGLTDVMITVTEGMARLAARASKAEHRRAIATMTALLGGRLLAAGAADSTHPA